MAENVFLIEEMHHTNIQNTFDTSDSGPFNDVEFTLSDGSKLRANKFVLASQSEYFYTMFYGSLKHGESVPLMWCSKTSMAKVLAFLSVGKVDIGELEIMELLELLEAARLMCLENLFNFIETYVEQFINESSYYGKMPSLQTLMALDFALVKQFESVTIWLLLLIDRNIKDFMKLKPEEAGVLSANGMIILLGYEGSAKRIDVLSFFIIWKEASQDSGIDIAKYVKLEKLNPRELRIARASNLYSSTEITDNLERIVAETTAEVKSLNQMIVTKDYEIEDMENEIEDKENEIEEKENEIDEMEIKIEEKNSENENLKAEIEGKDDEIEKKNIEIEYLKQCLATKNCDC